MAHDSKKKRRDRRNTRQVTLYFQVRALESQAVQLKQAVNYFRQQHAIAKAALATVLAHHGREMVVTKGTLQHVIESLERLHIVTTAVEGRDTDIKLSLVEDEEKSSEQQELQQKGYSMRSVEETDAERHLDETPGTIQTDSSPACSNSHQDGIL